MYRCEPGQDPEPEPSYSLRTPDQDYGVVRSLKQALARFPSAIGGTASRSIFSFPSAIGEIKALEYF